MRSKNRQHITKSARPSHRRARRIILVTIGLLLLSTITAAALSIAPYAAARMDMSLLDIPAVSAPATLVCYEPAARADRTGPLHVAANSTLAPTERRVFVPYDDLPPSLIHAFVAIEDKRFYDHHGVDFLRTLRAVGGYVTGQSSFGGSTITQQLVKNLTGHDEATPERKLREVFLALDLERNASKEVVLETYLNIINLAEGCRGVGAAAQCYYSKSVSELTLSECAAIAAITNNPARYDPLTHPEANRARRDLILREMADQGYITARERDTAIAAPLDLHPSADMEADKTQACDRVPSWYADLVAADVIRDLTEKLGCTRAHASMLLYSGGLTVECAMDEDLQAIVEKYYADNENFPMGVDGRPQSSFLLMDPETGDILAVAGAIGEKSGARVQNYATDTRRPAGSCIKPLSVYAPALEEGRITWATLCDDSPLRVQNGVSWPANADGRYRGKVLVGEAVSESLNTVAVRLTEEKGVDVTLAFLRDRLHMQSLVLPGNGGHDATLSSLALGQQTRGVTSRELTAAYTILYDGTYRPAVSYHRVLAADGRVILENPIPTSENGLAEPVISPGNAAVLTRLLMGVTDHGTAASRITLPDTLGIECVGKTGTTQQNCDRRYVGCTPRLLAGVWMGYDYPAPLDGIGGNPCITIWDDLMTACERAYRGAPPKPQFTMPDNVISLELCPLSGELATPYCTHPDATVRPPQTDPATGDTRQADTERASDVPSASEGEESSASPLGASDSPASNPVTQTERGWFVQGTEPHDSCSRHDEPPIVIAPEDPTDPDRIPQMPGDLLPAEPPLSPEGGWLSRWFRRHAGT